MDSVKMKTDRGGIDHNGAFLRNCQVIDPWAGTIRPWATSPIEAELVWKLSEKLVGQEFSYDA